MSPDNYQDDVCQFFTEPNIGIDTNVVDNSINCLILNKASRETDKFEVPPFLWSMETNTIHRSPFTGYTRLLYSVPMHQGFRWEVSRIHIKGSYFGSDTTAELDVEARYLGRSIFLDLLASLEMVFRSPTPQDWWLKKWILPDKWINVGFDPPPFRTKLKKSFSFLAFLKEVVKNKL